MKKEYIMPLLKVAYTGVFYDICNVSGSVGDDSGKGEGEEDLAKGRGTKNDGWGNLW